MYNLTNDSSLFPILEDFTAQDYLKIDLSSRSTLFTQNQLNDPLKMAKVIDLILNKKHKKVAFGGYLEKRTLYKRSSLFQSDAQERNIHLGVDFWAKKETKVKCPEEGVVHSFAYNDNAGDYGPTIIIKHNIVSIDYYTLYGHLSLDSLTGLEIGTSVKKGDLVGKLGDHTENGGYAPHLHFQLIKDMKNYMGDFPGVCSSAQLEEYKSICPNPMTYLGIELLNK